MTETATTSAPVQADTTEEKARKVVARRALARKAQRRYRVKHRRIEYHPTRRAMTKIERYMDDSGARLMGVSMNAAINEMIESWRYRR